MSDTPENPAPERESLRKAKRRKRTSRLKEFKKETKKLQKRLRDWRVVIPLVAIVAFILGFGIFALTNGLLGVHQATLPVLNCPVTGCESVTYVTSSGQNTSQWLVIRSTSVVLSVSNNVSGTLQKYATLASLNETMIGYYCTNANPDGSCSSFQYFSEQGWFWDSVNSVLYVHYVGGPAVKITLAVY